MPTSTRMTLLLHAPVTPSGNCMVCPTTCKTRPNISFVRNQTEVPVPVSSRVGSSDVAFLTLDLVTHSLSAFSFSSLCLLG